jgi:glycosyltransferase involved in cell wall biosynthesis
MAGPFLGGTLISVVIPAHNEARVIGRLLERLVTSAEPGELDVVVVANGCTDNTVEIASAFGPPVRVLNIPAASKPAALAAGDSAAKTFPRVYVDADVVLRAQDLRALGDALLSHGLLAVGPEREFDMTGRPWPIRWYFDVWTRLPEVQRGLFGRGVIAFSGAGHARIANMPPVLADDLAVSLAFAPHERAVVPEARAVIQPPRKIADLLRRRVRAAEGIAQLERGAALPNPSSATTKASDLLAMTRERPSLAPRITFFIAVAVIAKVRARRAALRNDYSTWRRDESSRR